MKVKLDENLPNELMSFLSSFNHDVDTVATENLCGAEDTTVLEAATREGRVFMTFDTDFADIRTYRSGTHAGIVVFRLSDQRWEGVYEGTGPTADEFRCPQSVQQGNCNCGSASC